jgi:hypothetical protein
VIETGEKGEVIFLLVRTPIVVEEAGDHDGLLVVSDVLYHDP